MNNLQNNQKSDAAPMGYDTLLAHVVSGVKLGIPIYKTLNKYKWNKTKFYKKSTNETIRYLNELKCLKVSKRGKCVTKISNVDTADFNVC